MPTQTTVSKLKSFPKERGAPRDIGTMLIESGWLKVEDVERVLRLQKETGLPFGEAAVRLGLVELAHVNEALAQQFEYRYLIPGQSRISHEVVAAYEPFSSAVDELRALRAQLLVRHFAKPETRRALAVVGCDTGGGRSYLSANLAVVFSQLGQRTLLVDADLRNPRQHEIFGLANGKGLSTLLAGRSDLSMVERVPGLIDLSVLTSGPVAPNPAELLEREAFVEVLDQLSDTYDVVLFDTPSMSQSVDASSVAQRVGAAIVVVRRYRARVRALQALVAAMPGVNMLGTVLNDR